MSGDNSLDYYMQNVAEIVQHLGPKIWLTGINPVTYTSNRPMCVATGLPCQVSLWGRSIIQAPELALKGISEDVLMSHRQQDNMDTSDFRLVGSLLSDLWTGIDQLEVDHGPILCVLLAVSLVWCIKVLTAKFKQVDLFPRQAYSHWCDGKQKTQC